MVTWINGRRNGIRFSRTVKLSSLVGTFISPVCILSDSIRINLLTNIQNLANANICHLFIIRFYGAHLSLLLHSFRLQISIISATISKQALWMTYRSSLDLLRLLVGRLVADTHLYYMQYSNH